MFKHAQLESVKAWIGDPERASLPLHVRIQRAIRQLVLEGALPVGKALPASRALAASLAVSRDTVEAAYGQLHAEGFIERRVGSGSFVSPRAQHLPAPPRARKVKAPDEPPAISRRGQALCQEGGVHNFFVSRPFAPGVAETRNFPLQAWEKLQRQVFKEHGSQALEPSSAQGTEPLRRAIADYVNLERGAQATADRVLILTSSQQAFSLCAHVLADAGDQVVIEDPAYHGVRKALGAAGLHCIAVAVDTDGMQVAQITRLAPHARAAFLTPSHQFPTGVTLSLDRRLAVIEWARQQRAWIIEDDYDSEFHYAGKPTACVQGLDAHDRTVYIGTFTKSLFAGLRIAYMVLPPQLVEPMTAARTLQDGHTASLAQLTLARFIEGGHFGAHVRLMRAIYAERRDALAALVQAQLSDFLVARVPAGGMQMPCVFTRPMPEEQVVKAAQAAGIDLLGLSGLYASTKGEAGLLMGFAAHTPGELAMAVAKLAKVLRQVESGQGRATLPG
ncbi:PLP-dependent aminotransferase family protein [Pseudomonas shirazica]|uniref:MocR-like pyridoxine biosynthesis transcription factor PdxR n=1 Tax=Pseudomonas shirazica TaxID=1940636 RepID=UPI0034D49683